MKINDGVKIFIGLYIIFCIQDNVNPKTSKWLKDLVTFIQNDKKHHQVIILYDRNEMNQYNKIEKTILEISSKVPALKISFHEATNEKAKQLSLASIYDHQNTMIIIIQLSTNSGNFSVLQQPINFASEISESRRPNKCLIILPKEEKTFPFLKLLQLMWSRQFLDVTILEIFLTTNPAGFNFIRPPKEAAIIHQFNPFTNTYNRIIHSETILWFPKNTIDLHGHKMKVGLFDYPPFVFIDRNGTGYITDQFGPDVLLTKELSKKINFTIVWVSLNNETDWGQYDCIKEKNTGHMHRVMYNEIQFIGGIQSLRFGSCFERFIEWTTGSRIIKILVAVPVAANKSTHLLITWKNFNVIIILIFFLITSIISHKLGFKSKMWRFMEVLRIIFGITTVREPKKLAERIIFGSMLLSCLLHSSFIYSSFSDVSLQEESEVEMKTINDVLVSNLQPFISQALFTGLSEHNKGPLRKLLNKSIKMKNLSHLCLERLIENKNVACITLSEAVKWKLANEKKNCGHSSLRVVEESIKLIVTGFMMEARSPYVDRFDEIILRLVQSGIIDKWDRGYLNNGSSNSTDADESCRTRGYESIILRRELVWILFFGNMCAIIVFLCEVVCGVCRKKDHDRKEYF